MSANIACILLAAGFSRRFGGPKLLHKMNDGQPMLLHSIEIYRAVFPKVHVVIGESDTAQNNELRQLLQTSEGANHIDVITTRDAMRGMSQSIVAGINATSEADGWLIALADMPFVDSKTVRTLTLALSNNTIVMPRYRDRTGNPVGFGAAFRDELLGLTGDRGAKSVTAQAGKQCLYIDVNDPGILLDIDKPDDLR